MDSGCPYPASIGIDPDGNLHSTSSSAGAEHFVGRHVKRNCDAPNLEGFWVKHVIDSVPVNQTLNPTYRTDRIR